MVNLTAAVALSWCGAFLLQSAYASEPPSSSEVYLFSGKLRIQALSPTLLRVEPQGPKGFEDRPTFTVVNRGAFGGIPAWIEEESDLGVVVATDHYKIHLQADAGVYWQVTDKNGALLYDAVDGGLARDNIRTGFHSEPNLLHWPAPLSSKAYALVDLPRFVVPEWGPAPAPSDVETALKDTNGFDFRNNMDGDTYLFLLGSDLGSWEASRKEFLQLTGPCPILPSYAYGTWFTQWHNYTQNEAMAEVKKWDELQLPIDVWGLDMNWRNTTAARNNEMSINIGNSDGSDWFYDREDTALFPNFTAWFSFLQSRRLKTYFNDHPYPVASRGAGGLQTSPEETEFRWNGLTKWLQQGLDFWWFDRNWRFSIPPPFVNTSRTGAAWYGLDNAVWGSYLYFSTAKEFGARANRTDPPLSLTKCSPIDWRAGLDPTGHQEHPAQHRYPVWWTGDGVPLQASVESMVDAGLHDFKPFVHSDCGKGFADKSAGLYMRWLAHCTYGTIVRIHGTDDQPWIYDDHVTDVVRRYLNARYRLLPSLVASGVRTTLSGFPLVARGDFYWPDHAESSSNQQYLFLDDILVAPIWEAMENVSTRSVWIPPGSWEDAWNGSIVSGPAWHRVTQPYERQPMWHRRGGMLVLARSPGLRTSTQDWSSLVVEAFPSAAAGSATSRTVYEKDGSVAIATLVMRTVVNQDHVIEFRVMVASSGDSSRAWLVRLHLLRGQAVGTVHLDGRQVELGGSSIATLIEAPDADSSSFFPLGGEGAAPPFLSGSILEVEIPQSTASRHVSVTMQRDEWLVLS